MRVLPQEGPELGCLWPLAPAAMERLAAGLESSLCHSSGLAGVLVLPLVALRSRPPLDGAMAEPHAANLGKGLDVLLKKLQGKGPLNVNGFSLPEASL